MKKHFVGFFFLLLPLLLLHKVHGSYKNCIEEEKKALLELKEFFLFDSDDEGSEKVLPTWVDNKGSFCCAWERVSCDSTTGRVIKLDLNYLRESPIVSTSSPLPLPLNASLFLPFRELQIMEMAGNELRCCVENQGLERLSSLKKLEKLNLADNDFSNVSKSLGALKSLKFLNLSDAMWLSSTNENGFLLVQGLSNLRNLETLDVRGNGYNSSFLVKGLKYFSQLKRLKYLDLSYNNFNRDIFGLLGALPSLKYLILELNDMEGPLPNQEISKLSSLEVLILSGNKLNGELPIRGLRTFKNLKILDLSDNSFAGSIPSDMGALTSLQALSLADNQLNGSLTLPGLCQLKGLQELDISINMFEGVLPQCLSNLSSLRVLDLSSNRFRGRISPSLITSLTSLEYIDIRHNIFDGPFQFSWITNHSRLKVLEVGHNGELEIEFEDSLLSPKFQLNVLTLAKCNVNKHTGNIPKFLVHQDELEVIDLSHNNLKGEFPYWLLQNKPMLYVLNLRNNSFSGQLQLPPRPHTSIFWMDLSNNHFNGQLKPSFGMMLPNVAYLNLSRNGFGGMLPSSICDMSSLFRLDLSLNNFSGEVPRKLVGGCCPNLGILKLSSNDFHGEIFSSDYNLTSLTILHLDDNRFSGTLPPALSNSSSVLAKLDIGSNYFSGAIPDWAGNLFSLESVIMKNNFFRGRLPSGPSQVNFLDISNNLLSEALPSQPDMQFAEHIHLQGNKFSGPMPQAFLNLSFLLTLDLRYNGLSGNIPAPVSENSNLRVLLLSGNRLSGSIPDQLCKLEKMSLMDLSNNSLSGSIPRCFNGLAFGSVEEDVQVFKTQALLSWYTKLIGSYGSLMVRMLHVHDTDDMYSEEDQVDFVTKSRPYSYKGDILNYMSGLDLSCNNLTREIPLELGRLSWIHALNLSHNQLQGSIPKTFSNLEQIESLDLSHNSLSGDIPSELTNLHFLEVFSVAYNNLSGKIPDMKDQFGTFDSISYEGNPFLCGLPLNKSCGPDGDSTPTPVTRPDKTSGGWHETDPVVFFTSFSVSYVVFLLGFFSVLYINPYWRGRLFYHTEEFLYSCYYFVSNVIRKLQTCCRYR